MSDERATTGWRPAVEPTTGVRFLPGFKNKPQAEPRCAQCHKIGDGIAACSGGGANCAMLHPETALSERLPP